MTREEIGELIRKGPAGPAGWAPVESALDALYARIDAADAEIARLTELRAEALRERDETHAAKVLADREAYRIGLEYADETARLRSELAAANEAMDTINATMCADLARAEALTSDLVARWSHESGIIACGRCWRPVLDDTDLCSDCRIDDAHALPTTGCG